MRHDTHPREVGYPAIAAGLTLVVLPETIALHLLLRLWNGTVAWTLTGLSLDACLWLLGDTRGLAARPIRLTPTHLALRIGLRWEADIPRAFIERAELDRPTTGPPKGQDTLIAALVGRPNVRLELDRPVEVIGMYGLRKRVRRIWLTVDDAEELVTQLGGAGA